MPVQFTQRLLGVSPTAFWTLRFDLPFNHIFWSEDHKTLRMHGGEQCRNRRKEDEVKYVVTLRPPYTGEIKQVKVGFSCPLL